MSKHRIRLMFEHPTCCDIVVDIYLPMPNPIAESAEALADRVRPACPICKEPMRYAGFSFSSPDEVDNDSEHVQ